MGLNIETAEEAKALVGMEVSFDTGKFKKPPVSEIVLGIIQSVRYQEEYEQEYYTGSPTLVPGHWRADVKVGDASHNLAVEHLRSQP